jgi:hypothetical protein
MSQQPELTTPQLAKSPANQPGQEPVFATIQTPSDRTIPKYDLVDLDPSRIGPRGMRVDPQRIPRWLERAELFLRVLLRMYIGLAIFYAPWSGQLAANFPEVLNFFPWSRMLWDQNPLFVQFPTLSIYAANGAVRGLVSGLGLLNLWIAFHDALHHRDG